MIHVHIGIIITYAQTYMHVCSTIVWEKFTAGYFHVRIVHGKIFSSLGVSEENCLTTV